MKKLKTNLEKFIHNVFWRSMIYFGFGVLEVPPKI